METLDPGLLRFRQLLEGIGLSIVAWQSVENSAFRLFASVISSPSDEITSVLFYHIQSFESRVQLLDRIMYYYIKSETIKSEWKVLKKELESCTKERNKIVHYSLSMEKDENGTEVYKVAPSYWDKVAPILGRTPNKPNHSLTITYIYALRARFQDLSNRIDTFRLSLSGLPPTGLLGQLFSPHIQTRPITPPQDLPSPTEPETPPQSSPE